MKKNILFLLVAITLSSCDWHVHGQFNNKTPDDIRIVCYYTDSINQVSAIEKEIDYRKDTGGRYFGVDMAGKDTAYHQLNDNVAYINIPPKGNFGFSIGMNLFWNEERIASYLRFVKKMEIYTAHDTIIYNGKKELTDFFQVHQISRQKIQINIKEKSLFSKLRHFLNL